MREMGVTFDIARERPWGRRPWFCDVLPQIFTPEEWEPLAEGFQRLRAFELFLRDIYGRRKFSRLICFRSNLCLEARLTSGRRRAHTCGDAYLHLSGISLCRVPSGELQSSNTTSATLRESPT